MVSDNSNRVHKYQVETTNVGEPTTTAGEVGAMNAPIVAFET